MIGNFNLWVGAENTDVKKVYTDLGKVINENWIQDDSITPKPKLDFWLFPILKFSAHRWMFFLNQNPNLSPSEL